MRTSGKKNSKRRSRGVAMVETAVVLPIVLLLILATGELGRAFWQYNMLTKAVQDAARFAAGQALFGSTGVIIVTDDLVEDVQNLVVYGNASGTGAPLLSGLTTTGVTLESPGDNDILVRATYEYAPLFDLLPTFDGGGIATIFGFEAVVRMRAL